MQKAAQSQVDFLVWHREGPGIRLSGNMKNDTEKVKLTELLKNSTPSRGFKEFPPPPKKKVL